MSWDTSLADALAGSPLLERLCIASFEFLVASLILAAIVRWTRPSSPRLVASLWLIVLAKPVVTLAAGAPIPLLDLRTSPAVTSPSAAGTAPAAPESAASTDILLEPAFGVTDAVDGGAEPAGPRAAGAIATERAGFEAQPLRLGELLLFAWSAGVVYGAVRYLLARRRLRQLVRRATRAPEELERVYAELARELGIARPPALRVTEDLESPALVGLARPVVLLPRWLVARGGGLSREWALRHELAHWRWRDPLAILVRDVASILYFFHPALPWASRRHAEAMEMACDGESLRHPSEAPDYAELLCEILDAIRGRQSERASRAALAMATQGRTARRIAALLEGRCPRPLSARGAAGVGLLGVLVLAFGCAVSRESEPAAAAPTPAPPAGPDAGGQADGSARQEGVVQPERRETSRGIEKSVLDGLRWLARHQNPDGSWSPATLNERCPCEEPLYSPAKPYARHYDVGLTGLALLGFLGAGFGDDSKQEIFDPVTGQRHVAGDVVRKGLEWLVARQDAAGSFSGERAFMYNVALAGLALTRACGLARGSAWKEPAQKSIRFLEAAQRPSPRGEGLWGWRYAPRQEVEAFHRAAGSRDTEMLRMELHDADTSITGWCMLALASGASAGLTVDQQNLDGGLAFVRFVTQVGADGQPTGLVGYLDPKGAGAKVTGPNDHFVYHPATMSAIGMCVRALAGPGRDDPVLERSTRVLAADLPAVSGDKLSIDYYYWHYATLALNLYDGPDAQGNTGAHWGPWSQAVADCVLALQDRTERDCRSGGWIVPDRWGTSTGGPLYATALNVLTLELHYRYEDALGSVKRR